MVLNNFINKKKSIILSALLTLIVFQILLLINITIKGIHKYFLLKEKNLIERYGKESWVVITGASSGQGYDMAISFAKRGFNLLLIGSKRTDNTITEINRDYPNVKTKVIYKDFREAFKDDFFNDIQETFNEIGKDLAILVNNVGYRVGWNPYHEMDSSHIRDVIVTGTIVQSRLTHMIIPFFIKRRREKKKTSCLINITSQCLHPNFLFGITLSNEISVPYLSIYEASNSFGFYQGSSIYKEYKNQFDILNITPGAVITNNTGCLSDTMFNISSKKYVNNIIKLIGNINGNTCAYWGHAISGYLINLFPIMKNNTLKKVGETIASDFMNKNDKKTYTIVADTSEADTIVADTIVADTSEADTSVADTSVADTSVAEKEEEERKS